MFLRIIYTEKNLGEVEELFYSIMREFGSCFMNKGSLHIGTYYITANHSKEFDWNDPILWNLRIPESYKTRVQIRDKGEGCSFCHPNCDRGDVYGMLLEGLGKHRTFEYIPID